MRQFPALKRGLCAVLLVGSVCGASFADTDVYYARQIWTGSGVAFAPAVLVVRDGKIVAVGERGKIDTPPDATAHDLREAVLIPGLVVPETGLASGSRDGQRAVAPELRAVDGFDFFADQQRRLAGGVTTVQVSPGGARLMPGQGAVVKLAGDSIDQRTLKAAESLRIVLSQASRNPPLIFDPPVGPVSVDKPLNPSSPQISRSLAGAVSGLRAVLRAARKRPQQVVDDLETDLLLRTVAGYRHAKRTVRITASTAAEIQAATSLAREFDLRIILVDARELDPFADQFAHWKPHVRGVLLNARIRPGAVENPPILQADAPRPSMPWKHSRMLIENGLKVGVRAASDDDLPEMLFLAGLFLQSGLSKHEILRMITTSPAELLGVADRVGELAVGKDADFVALTGEPFAASTQVSATYVSGKRVYDRAAAQATSVVQAGAVYDGAGRVMRGGSIVIEAGKIRQVGRDVSAPLNAIVRRFPQAVVVPGYIDLATSLGLGGPLSGSVPLQTKLGEQLFSGDPAVAVARQGGVTTVLLGPTGTSPSPLVAFKLGDKLRVLKDPVALRFSLKGNLSTATATLQRTLTQAKTYADSWTKYETLLAEYQQKLKEYEDAKAKYDAEQAAQAKKKAEEAKTENKQSSPDNADAKQPDANGKEEKKEAKPAPDDKTKKPESEKGEEKKPDEKKDDASADEAKDVETKDDEAEPPTKPQEPKKPSVSATLEPYRPLFANKIPAFVEARTTNELRAALKLFCDEFKLRTVLIGADDVARDPELLSQKEVGVSLGPKLTLTVDRQLVNPAQLLANRQIPFGFQSQATTGVKTLPRAVQFAVRKGLGVSDALGGLTASPADMLSLDDQVGSLVAGKDADLVVLSGPPFELSSVVLAVMIDGKWVFEKENESWLED